MHIVDLRSDTVTKPTAAMREAMARAEVGDDVLYEDPTVNELQRRSAELFGKEAALFVPSGTMGNLLAILSQTRPGDAIIISAQSHPYHHESANLSMVAGVLPHLVPTQDGLFTADEAAAWIVQTDDHHHACTTLISIENTANRGGGSIYTPEHTASIGRLARDRGLCFHCDGARIFNAVVALGVSPEDFGRHVDTLCFCLSKGLGAPVGSVLVGDGPTMDRAHRFRKMLGGGMRQAGILAAAGLYALENNVARLSEDHRRAAEFRRLLEGVPGIAFPHPSPTNMVYVQVTDAPTIVKRIAEKGVLAYDVGPNEIRFVFHLDIDDNGVGQAATAVRESL